MVEVAKNQIKMLYQLSPSEQADGLIRKRNTWRQLLTFRTRIQSSRSEVKRHIRYWEEVDKHLLNKKK